MWKSALTDPRARTEIANGQLAAGAITLNEYRELLGWKPITDGDLRYVAARVTGGEKLPAENTENTDEKPERPNAKAQGREDAK